MSKPTPFSAFKFFRLTCAIALAPMLTTGLAVALPQPASAASMLDGINLPSGFSISVYAQAPRARSLILAEELGVVFVATRHDRVYAIPLRDDDGVRPTYTVLTGLKSPNGIEWKDGYLYIAEQHRLTRYHVPSLDAFADIEPEVLSQELPDNAWHGNRYARFGPDGALYIGIGAPCNVCSLDGLKGTVTRFAPPNWTPEVVATGVRNTVGIDIHPTTGQIHFTDNGADGMGDDSPPDELNALEIGGHYGFPWFGGGDDRTPQFAQTTPPKNTLSPVVKFQAHTAPLGVDFYDGQMFPAEYRGDAFVAQHGSWNRSKKVGYRVMRIRFDGDGKVTGHEPFIDGWLQAPETVTGRPVDLEELPDGSLLISDDGAGLIYRVTYKKP